MNNINLPKLLQVMKTCWFRLFNPYSAIYGPLVSSVQKNLFTGTGNSKTPYKTWYQIQEYIGREGVWLGADVIVWRFP